MTQPPEKTLELIARWRRYAEIQDAAETRKQGRKATNTWAEGFRQAADLLASHHAAANELGWQPIETIPKDGSEVLVVVGRSERVCVAVWDDRRVVEASDNEGWTPGYEPTHWMPLPPPPAVTNRSET